MWLAVVPSAVAYAAAADAVGGGVWRDALQNYSAVAQQQRKLGEKGRYLVAFADDYGLGNRVNVVVSSLALAVATNRALAVVWPRVDCKRNAREFCDPTSIDDLFEPGPIAWGTNRYASKATSHCREERSKKRKSLAHWAMADPNDRGTADKYNELDLDQGWRASDKVLCAYGYFYWGWCVTCNAHVRSRFGVGDGGSPWVDFGEMQSWLLKPSHAVRKRVDAILGKRPCDVGLHLRRADEVEKKAATPSPKWVKILEALLAENPRLNLFVAADHESSKTRRRLVEIANNRGATVLVDETPATRNSEAGIYAALAENFVLSSCEQILPRGTGASTFHDMAVARAAFERRWDDAKIAEFASRTKETPPRPLISPALCSDLRPRNASRESARLS